MCMPNDPLVEFFRCAHVDFVKMKAQADHYVAFVLLSAETDNLRMIDLVGHLACSSPLLMA